jgi:SAM-dependent methyltransferase
VPERLRWAVEVLDPQPHEELLEIGCGGGVAADLVCQRLATGRLHAVDRSSVAVERASRRGAKHLAAGRLVLHLTALADLPLAPGSIDAAFAVDVNAFWVGDARAELAALARVLRPGGRLHLLWGRGPADPQRVLDRVSARLTALRFEQVVPRRSPAGTGVSARAPRDGRGR